MDVELNFSETPLTAGGSREEAVRRGAVASAVAVALTCAGALSGGSEARAARVAPDQTLAGKSVLKAQGASVATVVLPETVRVWHPWLDPDQPDFTIRGGKGTATFALVAADAPATEPLVLLGGRLPADADSAPYLTHFGLGPEGPAWEGFWDVPKGRYRLFVFTKEPVTLTLSLDGLKGRTAITPTGRARYEEKAPKVLAGTDPVHNLYSGGATGSLAGEVSQLQVFWTREAAHASSYSGFCWYNGEPPDDTVAFAPACPTADSQDVVEMTGLWAGESLTVGNGLRLSVPTGRSGQGLWLASAAAVTDVGHVAAWLDLGL